MLTAILFILMMLVLIAPHELGHFIVAKLVGVKVNEFSIGMGPLIWQKQKGETKYSLRLIPIGGYNAMEGEDDSSEDPRGFNNQSSPARIAILLAGVTMNVIIALLICWIIVFSSGLPTTKIASVDPNMPAGQAGISVEDRIVAVNGTELKDWSEFTGLVDSYKADDKKAMEITVDRDGEKINYSVIPQYNKDEKRYMIGIVADVTHNPIKCFGRGAVMTWELNTLMFKSFGMLIRGEVSSKDVSGPVGLVKVVNTTSKAGAEPYLLLLALVSLNLAILNLLPIPGLDGGKILFVILKWITRGRISDEMETKATLIGFTLLLMLMVFVTVNDISNIFH